MGNQCWGLGFCLVLISSIFVANTYMCLGAGNITAVACPKQERQALLKFKHSLEDEYNMLSSWVGDDCCLWERVHCDGVTGYVQGLHLRGLPQFEGLVSKEVSTCLGELRHLKYLDLSQNDFQRSRIPDFIGSLKQLTYLNLSHSSFSGNIPHHIGNLSSLKVLDLSSYIDPHTDPPLMVDDMAWISGLSSLEHLDLSNVNLTGATNHDMVLHRVPSLVKLCLSRCGLSDADLVPLLNSSTTLNNIKHLDLSYNFFYGQFPRMFQNLTSLQFLDLSSGFNLSLAWKFVDLLRLIPSLSELHLSHCSLHEIHLSPTHVNLSTLSNIQHLDLSYNLFKDRFPSVLTNMSSLRILDLSWNKLNSSVPVIPNLLELDLSFNAFKQIQDVGIWRQCHLKQLTLWFNYFLMKFTDSQTNVSECSKFVLERLILHDCVYGTIPESLGRMANLIVLDLSSNELNGTIPKSFGRSRLLEVLDLSGNMLTSPIPTFLGKLTTRILHSNLLSGSIPRSIGRLILLEELDLSHNQLKGSIPKFLGKLTKIDLSYNCLNGSIPESIGKLTSLTTLILEFNALTGPIPASLGRLDSLQSFLVSSNFLNGSIPVSIGQLTKLQTLDVSNNSLEGVIFEAHFANLSMLRYLFLFSNCKLTFRVQSEWVPPFQLIKINIHSCKIAEERFPQWLQSQRKLWSLDLSRTTISGPLPTWFGKLSLFILDLSYNKLSGPLTNLPNSDTLMVVYLHSNLFNESIPRSLCKITNLYILDLSRNRLSGKIPKCLGDLQLGIVILSSNRLSGVIPSSLGHMSSLTWLNLNNNTFTGELPQDLVQNSNFLEILDLGDNGLTGCIPEMIGGLANLAVFRLHKNNFSGRIPPSLCQMSNLQILDGAQNNLSGPIPHCLGELRGMINASKRTFNSFPRNYSHSPDVIQVLKGVALQYTTTLQYVTNMDLSSNKLIGEIPVELTALRALVGLNLSNNHLTGSIPNNIGNMKALFSLDFSRNKLTGMIPTSIATLNFLSSLNLSHNNLSGRIPTGKQLQTLIDPSIYAENKDLCGAPLPKNCSNHEDQKTHPTNHKTTNRSNKAWLYSLDIMSGFATGFWGIIGVLIFKKKWRYKLFKFAEVIIDKIYVAVMMKVARMKRRREAT